ncbi:MAG: hypothetical protein QXF12_01525 [Candidatus Aenigmatarchaeota archaeon]
MPEFSSILSQLSRIADATLKSKSNKNIYLKGSRIAAKQFNFGNTGLDSRLPRHKFLFFINFVSPRPEITKNYNDFGTGISFLVKSFSKPGFSIRTEILNQYNKKRIVQSMVEYDPITITFYNTYDKKVIDFINDYMKFYFGDFKAQKSLAWNNDIIAPIFQYVSGNGPQDGIDWGFNFPPLFSGRANNKTFDLSNSYFFSEINLYQFGSGYVDKFTFVNPKITKVSFENEDYSEGNAPDMITVNLVYEGMILRENFSGRSSKRISSEEAEMFGFNYSDFNNVNFPCYNNNIELANKNYIQNNIEEKRKLMVKNQPYAVIQNDQNVSPRSASNSAISKNLEPTWLDNIFSGRITRSSTSSVGFNLFTVFNPNSGGSFSNKDYINFFNQ